MRSLHIIPLCQFSIDVLYDYHYSLRAGVTKASFVNFSVSQIFDVAKVSLRLFESHLYLTGATAAVKYLFDI